MIIKILLIDENTNKTIDRRIIKEKKSIDCLKIAKSYINKKMIGVE